MSYDNLKNVADDESKVDLIWETAKDVIEYFQLKAILKLGLSVNYDDLPFEDVMVFSWIREVLDDRKT